MSFFFQNCLILIGRFRSQPNINALIVKDFMVPVPSAEEQASVANTLDEYGKVQQNIKDHIAVSKRLISKVANEII